jgi:hypothetical protein
MTVSLIESGPILLAVTFVDGPPHPAEIPVNMATTSATFTHTAKILLDFTPTSQNDSLNIRAPPVLVNGNNVDGLPIRSVSAQSE